MGASESALAPPRSAPPAAVAAAGGAAALGALALWIGPGPALALAACAVAGTGLTWLCGVPLLLEERLAFGAVLGGIAFCGAGFVLALAFGLTAPVVALAAALALAGSAPGWARSRATLGADVVGLRRRWSPRGWRSPAHPWPLLALLLIAWPFTFRLLALAYTYTDQGLVVLGVGVYGDWAAHLSYAGSFAYGHNFPPQYPVDPGHRLGYPFMVDFFAAELVPLGASLTGALVLTSGYLGLVLPAVVCLAGARLAGSIAASATGFLLFALGGGLGFLRLPGDIQAQGLDALRHLPRFYTQDPDTNYQWLNPVLAYLLPQRSVLFGIAALLLVLAVLRLALDSPRWTPFAFAGCVTGLLPAFHVHAYGTAVALAAFWALGSRRRHWVAFFGPALLLGLPQLLWLIQPGAAGLRLQPGWLADTGGHHDGGPWFWFRNTGLLIPVMAAGFALRGVLSRGARLLLLPTWLWFLVPNFVVFQPWDWDNTKFFMFWALLGCLPAGALLVWLARRGLEARVLAVALALVLCASGALDLARAADPVVDTAVFMGPDGAATAQWVRESTPRDAIFLVAPEHNQPVAALGGRRVVVGYGGWLWTYGLADWSTRTDDARLMLQGDPSTPELVRRYGVGYVVIGPQERGSWGASQAYWSTHADLVHAVGGFDVYRVRGG